MSKVSGLVVQFTPNRKKIIEDIEINPSETDYTSDIMEKVGFPISIKRLTPITDNYPPIKEKDNQLATFLMINPKTGFAPMEWQKNVGAVILYRKDDKKLEREDIELLWDYLAGLMNFDLWDNSYTSWKDISKSKWLTPSGFQEHCKRFKEI